MESYAFAVRIRVTRKDGSTAERWFASSAHRNVAASLHNARFFPSIEQAIETAKARGVDVARVVPVIAVEESSP